MYVEVYVHEGFTKIVSSLILITLQSFNVSDDYSVAHIHVHLPPVAHIHVHQPPHQPISQRTIVHQQSSKVLPPCILLASS